ncbi:MAG: transporter substrate-binding domain-containing protein [Clostridium sp.]
MKKKISKSAMRVILLVSIVAVIILIVVIFMVGRGGNKKNLVDAVRKRGELRVAIADTGSQFISMEGDTPVGKESEIAKQIAAALGVSVTYIIKTPQELQETIKNGEADIALGCIEKGSAGDMEESTVYGKADIYMVVFPEDYANTKGAFKNKVLGAGESLGSRTGEILKSIEGVSVHSYTDWHQAMADMDAGEIDGYCCYESEAKEFLKKGFRASSLPGLGPEEYVAVAAAGQAEFMNGVNVIIQNYLEPSVEE